MNIKRALLLFLCVVTPASRVKAQPLNFYPSDWVGIQQAAPTISFSELKWRLNNTTAKQAMIRMDVIGNGPGQVPPGSQILLATLRLTAITGGDGWLYRAAEPWDGTTTWDDVGDVATVGAAKGAGITTTLTIDVTDHVTLWSNGTFNDGWVLKGAVNDSTDTEIYDGAAGDNLAPRLQVTFTPPDNTPPTITDIDIGSTVSTHPDYDIPAGSGEQLRTVPIAKPNQVFVTFSENVTNVSSTTVFLATKSGTSIPASVSYASGVATLQLASPITVPTKVVLTVLSGASGVRDAANNQLDGEWTNPASLGTASSKNFPSGNGSAGGNFVFNFTLLPGDYNVDNVSDSADYTVWRNNKTITSGALFTQGDGDGDGDVDNDDYNIWRGSFGVDQTSW